MLGALSLPPRLVLRALDDLHTLAEGLRSLTQRQGDLEELLAAVKALPGVEDELSVAVAELRADVRRLHEWLQPLHDELADVDETAEKLETSLKQVDTTIAAFHAELRDLRGRIPGI